VVLLALEQSRHRLEVPHAHRVTESLHELGAIDLHADRDGRPRRRLEGAVDGRDLVGGDERDGECEGE
jgi:hypothetical protein